MLFLSSIYLDYIYHYLLILLVMVNITAKKNYTIVSIVVNKKGIDLLINTFFGNFNGRD